MNKNRIIEAYKTNFKATHFVTLHLKSHLNTKCNSGKNICIKFDVIDHHRTVEKYLNSVNKYFTSKRRWKNLGLIEKTLTVEALYVLHNEQIFGAHVHIALIKPRGERNEFFEKKLFALARGNPGVRWTSRRPKRGGDVTHLDPNDMSRVTKITYAPRSTNPIEPIHVSRAYDNVDFNYVNYMGKHGIENFHAYGMKF